MNHKNGNSYQLNHHKRRQLNEWLAWIFFMVCFLCTEFLSVYTRILHVLDDCCHKFWETKTNEPSGYRVQQLLSVRDIEKWLPKRTSTTTTTTMTTNDENKKRQRLTDLPTNKRAYGTTINSNIILPILGGWRSLFTNTVRWRKLLKYTWRLLLSLSSWSSRSPLWIARNAV